MGVIRLSFCFVNDNRVTPQGHFCHFNMDTLRIKFFLWRCKKRVWRWRKNLSSNWCPSLAHTSL